MANMKIIARIIKFELKKILSSKLTIGPSYKLPNFNLLFLFQISLNILFMMIWQLI